MTEETSTSAAAVANPASALPRRFMAVINVLTVVGGMTLIIMSFWPGYAGGCIALLALPLIALLGVAWLLVASRALPRPWGTSTYIPLRAIIVAPFLVPFTFALLLFYIPRRVAFLVCQESFEQLLPSAPAAGADPVSFGRWVGMYHVDECATDARGGVYFRTGTGPDGIGPDTMSYGFVYRPNREGSPFGAAHYAVRRLSGGWYWFRASNDWF